MHYFITTELVWGHLLKSLSFSIQAVPTMAASQQPKERTLPPGWEKRIDYASGQVIYYID